MMEFEAEIELVSLRNRTLTMLALRYSSLAPLLSFLFDLAKEAED